jgi:hypothetical protein
MSKTLLLSINAQVHIKKITRNGENFVVAKMR